MKFISPGYLGRPYARRPPRAVATMVAPPGWRRSSIVPAPATPGQGGLTRVLRDRLSAMRVELLPGRL